MGVDIDLRTDKEEEIKTDEYFEKYFYEHSLSRTFCNMIGREYVADGESELKQIGRITGIDISPIFQMGNYINKELEFVLDGTESEEERRRIMYVESQPKGNLKGNIDKVLLTINALIDKVSRIDNLPILLEDHGRDTLEYETYFTDFSVDKGDGYIGNNFGQDLRNLKKFLVYVKDYGAT